MDKYVTLGEYKGLEVSVDTVEVDEDEWDTLVNNVYYGNITAENGGITDRAVETGDTRQESRCAVRKRQPDG